MGQTASELEGKDCACCDAPGQPAELIEATDNGRLVSEGHGPPLMRLTTSDSACSSRNHLSPYSPYFFVVNEDTQENERDEASPHRYGMESWICSRSVTIGAIEKDSDDGTPRRPKISHTLTEARRNVLDVDMDLLRGISLSRTLREGGRLWRCVPHELKPKDRMRFYQQSTPTRSIDIFFSHSWKTAGRWKVLSLFLQGNWLTVVIAWMLAVAVAFGLCAVDLLPMPLVYTARAAGFEAECPLGFWLVTLGMVAPFITPLACAYLPDRWRMSPVCFVDVACIHQEDATLMARGIYGIGGILSVSEELRVLWSEPYLSRLWCVFELAAFRKANPTGKITLAPLFVEGAVACIWVLFTFTTTMALILYSTSISIWSELLLQVVPVQVAAHILRGNYLAKHKLLSDLKNFDLSSVQCSSDFDREFIYEAITKWYSSIANFTAFVQDDLREELVKPILSSSMPSAYYLILVTPNLSVNLEVFLALWKGGAQVEVLLSHTVGSLAYCLCWCPAYLALLIYLCDRFASPRFSSRCMDRLQSLLLGTIVVILSDAGYFLARYCLQHGLQHSLIWAACAFVAGLAVWGRCTW